MTATPQAADRHERVSKLFLEAAELPADHRDAFLHNQCADDPDLHHEVLELLAYDSTQAAVDDPLVRLDRSAMLADVNASIACNPPTPIRIGTYEILSVLGEGGMGTVYGARQDHPDRLVALKVIRPGIATPEVVKRFELESRLLGRLHHPGIAQVYEAGTADCGLGTQPYFAMELVTGCSLLSHVQQHQLNSRARLELLAKVCDAVQHAHQHGIVHRDLKPGNILVDETGQPKILDFGVARIMDADIQAATLCTGVGQLLGTLPYMSPEQVQGDSALVDARSDVYSLGVIAYELLGGRLPHDVAGKSVLEAARIIQTDPVIPLRLLDRQLRGDIETIVTKAMEKDKARRYPSAAEMAADIRRYLRDEPITARPPSSLYQLRKFARRHRTLVVGTAVAFALLVAAVVGTSYGLIVARSQRDQARRAADRAEAIRQFFLGILTTPAPGVLGREVKVIDALVAAEEDIHNAFPDQPQMQADVYAELAATFARLGEYDKAERNARESLRIRQQTLGDSHIDTLKAMNNLGNILCQPNREQQEAAYDEARILLDRAISLLEKRSDAVPVDLIDSLNNRAALAFKKNQCEDAERLTRKSLDLAIQHLGTDSRQTITARQNLAVLLKQDRKYEEAERDLRRIAELLVKEYGERDPATLDAQSAHAGTLVDLKQYDDAEAIYLRNLPIANEVMGPDHATVVTWMNNYAFMLGTIERHAEAVEILSDALRRAEATLGSEDYLTVAIKHSLSISLVALNRIDEAERLLRDCVAGLTKLHGPAAETTLRESYRLVDVLIRGGKHDETVTLSGRQLALAEQNFASDTPAVAIGRAAAARSLLAAGRLDDARPILDACVRDGPVIGPNDHLVTRQALEQLTESCQQAGLADVVKALREK